MQLIPAIDIINGACVRLHQGRYDRMSQYSDDLPATAQYWHDQGAEWLHLVDLDGAKTGTPENLDAIHTIIKQTPQLHIEVGGGIRTRDTVARYFDLGVARIIIGSQAVKDPDFFARIAEEFSGKIVLGLDAQDGIVMTHGWLEQSQMHASALIEQFNHLPLAAIIYTDIARDGTLSGVNVESTLALAQETDIDVFASGGVSSIQDIIALHQHRDAIAGVIIGKSLYEGTLVFSEALAYLETPDGR